MVWARRSISLLMVTRLDIGLKLHGSLGSSEGFLRSGVICAVLKVDGNLPWLKDRLAMPARSVAKTDGQALRRYEGTVSTGEALAV